MTGMDVMKPVAALAGEREINSNNITTVTKYFGMNGYAYCGMTVKYGFKKAGCALIDKCTNPFYVPTIRQFMQDAGWRIRNEDARAGDIFCYGPDQHVGFVYEEHSGATKICLEGNATVYATLAEAKASSAGTGSFEGIGYKKRYLNSSYHVFRPPYDGGSGSAGSTSGVGSVGCNGYITEFQKWLNEKYAASLSVDGSFGKLTRTAAGKALQKYLNSRYNAGLVPDGAIGPLSKAAMHDNKVWVKKGDKNDLVYLLQGLLYCRGYDPQGFDGDFGSGTDAAVRSYQRAKSLTVDGEAGAQTFAALLKA